MKRPIERSAMSAEKRGVAKAAGARRRWPGARAPTASWQRKDAMDVFGSSRSRVQKGDGEHRLLSPAAAAASDNRTVCLLAGIACGEIA